MGNLRTLMTTDAVGGVWQYATLLAETLAARGVQVTLAVLGPPPDTAAVTRIAQVPGVTLQDLVLPLDWLSNGPAPVRSAAAQLAQLAREAAVDLVHLNSPILAAAASFDVPAVVVAHGCPATWWAGTGKGALAPEFHWHRALSREGLLAASRVVAPTQAFAGQVRECYQLPQRPLAVHNGSPPRKAPKGGNTALAVTVGRLWDEAKDIATLDRAARDARVPIVAAGPLGGPSGQQHKFANLNVTGKLPPAGVATLLELQPVFVSTAVFEPFGLSVLEAAQAGCPLVLSDIASFRELWDGAADFVPVRDATGFAAAINALAGDRDRSAEMGARAQERARKYTLERMADGMLTIYRDLAERRLAS